MRGRTDSPYEQFEISPESSDYPAIIATCNVYILLCQWNTLGGATSGPIGPLTVLRLVRLLAAVRASSLKTRQKTTFIHRK